MELFLDFVAIFRKLMVILAMNDKVPLFPHSIHSIGVSLVSNNNHLVLFFSQDKKKEKK